MPKARSNPRVVRVGGSELTLDGFLVGGTGIAVMAQRMKPVKTLMVQERRTKREICFSEQEVKDKRYQEHATKQLGEEFCCI